MIYSIFIYLQDFWTPEDVGLYLGPPLASPTKNMLMIEIHYDNPSLQSSKSVSGTKSGFVQLFTVIKF